MTPTDLIAQLEAAREGSLDLDWAIEKHLNLFAVRNSTWPALATFGTVQRSKGKSGSRQIKPFTTSLDAALTLVPEDREFRICKNRGGKHSSMPGIWYEAETLDYHCTLVTKGVSRATPALALCIAALKARHPNTATATKKASTR